MDLTNLKLLFLQRVLTDTVGSEEIWNSFFEKREFPNEIVMNEVINRPVDPTRLVGGDWPHRAHTMIGIKRLQNLHESLDYVRLNNLDGDFIETGVWRGGASIFAKVYFNLYGMNKKVFVADSFKGLPPPQVKEDEGDGHYKIDYLRVSLPEVKNNFELYNALDENVIFLEGWFEDTLPNNHQIEKLSILRMDGDLFKSTMDVFDSCYHKVVDGGVVIIDDFCIPNCKHAVEKFRQDNNYNEEVVVVDHCGIFWKKGV